MRRIVLASASPRRADLLRLLGLEFVISPCAVDETAGFGDPASLAESLALEKARSAAGRCGDGVVIAADTVVEIDGEVLGKPKDRDDARRMLGKLSGKEHRVTTGVAVIDAGTGRTAVEHETTRVWFGRLADPWIEAYIDTGEPMDKAGAYGIQGMGLLLIERIDGCYSNVVGLPLPRLAKMLRGFGIDLVSDAMANSRFRCSESCGLKGAGRWRNGGVCGNWQPEYEGSPRERATEGADHDPRSRVPVKRGTSCGDHQDG